MLEIQLPQSQIRDRAKQVIVEIVRQSLGNELDGKVKLFKAFYFAHLFYARDNADYLTEWPIVKMPNGPGIDDCNLLVNELIHEGQLTEENITIGPYPASRYRFVGDNGRSQLHTEATDAIRKAVEFVANKSGAQLSDITHEHSRSWNEAAPGEELPIYLDLLTSDSYDKTVKRSERVDKALDQIWG